MSPVHASDCELVRAAQTGSLAAFEELVRRHEAALLRFLVHRTGRHHDAEDLAQQTFLRAWRHLGRVRPEAPFAAWLFTIARRLAVDAWRARRPAEELREDHPAGDPPPDRGDLWAVARAALRPRAFEALWLMYGEGRSVREIAAALGMSRVAVKVELFRARRKLAVAWRAETAAGEGAACVRGEPGRMTT